MTLRLCERGAVAEPAEIRGLRDALSTAWASALSTAWKASRACLQIPVVAGGARLAEQAFMLAPRFLLLAIALIGAFDLVRLRRPRRSRPLPSVWDPPIAGLVIRGRARDKLQLSMRLLEGTGSVIAHRRKPGARAA